MGEILSLIKPLAGLVLIIFAISTLGIFSVFVIVPVMWYM